MNAYAGHFQNLSEVDKTLIRSQQRNEKKPERKPRTEPPWDVIPRLGAPRLSRNTFGAQFAGCLLIANWILQTLSKKSSPRNREHIASLQCVSERTREREGESETAHSPRRSSFVPDNIVIDG